MPSPRKTRAIQRTRRRTHRGRNFILATLVLIILVGVSYYVYSTTTQSTPSAATKPGKTGSGGSGDLTSCPTFATPSGAGTVTGDVYAKLNTAQGLMEAQLFANQAPKTVTNFVNLAQSGFYDNLVWHRIKQGFVIQTGDPISRNGGNRSLWGKCGSSQTVPLETDPSLHNDVGYLGMARVRNDLNSGTSQFYINLVNNPSLDGNYTVFGKVISGMDAAFAIGNVQVYNSGPYLEQPINPVYLTSVTISNSP